ncbi:DUF2917 domain-containing protein [Propionivibrio sp.]|jgi:hypothetical protein|uniref:DUF2917 domain-containing protein n=1 Tax=Propionivibrio sp. TaxID=2212460 RepID=UPI0039E25CAA
MLAQSTYLQIDLGVNEAASLRCAKHCELRCLSGKIWITEENSGRDIVLGAGESRRLTRPGQTIVQSLGEGAQCRLVLARSPYGLLALLRHWLPDAVAGKPGYHLVLGG